MTGPLPLAAIDAVPSTQRDPARARRGRPKLLTRELILTAALAMLDEGGLEGFTMNKLAQRLGASVMTLYTYFPSREALIDATADAIFNQFEPPAPDLPWDEAVAEWLGALDRLFEAFPIGLQLIKWGGAIRPSWMKVWMPLLHILSGAGLAGRELFIASNWIGRTGFALVLGRLTEREEPASLRALIARDRSLSAEDRALLASVASEEARDAGSPALRAFAVEAIVRGLADLIAGHPAPADRPSLTR